jgi:hypothetical protein
MVGVYAERAVCVYVCVCVREREREGERERERECVNDIRSHSYRGQSAGRVFQSSHLDVPLPSSKVLTYQSSIFIKRCY